MRVSYDRGHRSGLHQVHSVMRVRIQQSPTTRRWSRSNQVEMQQWLRPRAPYPSHYIQFFLRGLQYYQQQARSRSISFDWAWPINEQLDTSTHVARIFETNCSGSIHLRNHQYQTLIHNPPDHRIVNEARAYETEYETVTQKSGSSHHHLTQRHLLGALDCPQVNDAVKKSFTNDIRMINFSHQIMNESKRWLFLCRDIFPLFFSIDFPRKDVIHVSTRAGKLLWHTKRAPNTSQMYDQRKKTIWLEIYIYIFSTL